MGHVDADLMRAARLYQAFYHGNRLARRLHRPRNAPVRYRNLSAALDDCHVLSVDGMSSYGILHAAGVEPRTSMDDCDVRLADVLVRREGAREPVHRALRLRRDDQA